MSADPDIETADPPPGWEGILDPGERILWQGRPDGRVVWRVRHLPTMLFGAVFAGIALIWMILAARAGDFVWTFGLIHFAAGLSLILGPTLWPAFRRQRSWYTLTDRRAFIATDMPIVGKRLKSYPIDADTVLRFDGDDPGTIHFAQDYRRGKNGSRKVDIGFERIAEGRDVYALIRRVQRGAA